MCTGFVRKGKDIITGFNFDMNIGGMDYCPVIEKDRVFLGMRFSPQVLDMMPTVIRPKNGIRLIQGVSAGGHVAGQLMNMNFSKIPAAFEPDMLTNDMLTDLFVTDRYSGSQLVELLGKRQVCNIPGDNGTSVALHSLFIDPDGNIVFVEPGNGYAVIREQYFTVTNFSILEPPMDLNEEQFGFYGVDRYRKSLNILKNSTDDFTVADGLKLLNEVKQTGEWGTRFSFVYSRNEDSVYYCAEGQFDCVKVHRFAQ
jgi:hypothetical protein